MTLACPAKSSYYSTLNLLYCMDKNIEKFLSFFYTYVIFPFINGRKRRLFEECSCCLFYVMQFLRLSNPVLLKHKIRY